MKTAKFKESLVNRIRGWLPKKPKLPKSYSENFSGKDKDSVLNKPLSQLSKDTILGMVYGFLLIIVGVMGFIFNDMAVAAVQNIAMFVPIGFTIGSLFAFWIVIVGVVLVVVLVVNHTLNKAFFRKNFTRKRLLPYGVAAALFFLAYLMLNSGIQFTYAIPISFVVAGVLVMKGLKRFAVTLPAFAVLLISMLVLGGATAGPNVITSVSDDHVITTAQIPSINAINITARSVEGSIKLYFSNNSSEACKIQFVKEHGPVAVGSGVQYNGPSAYNSEPASIFYYYVNNSELYVIADSFTTLMNITVNENLIGNFSLYSYFGDLTANVPSNVNTVQTLNLTSASGTENLKISNTDNLRYISAHTGNALQADVTSKMQNQDATIVLNGGTVKLNLDVTNVESQIFCFQTEQWGTLLTNSHGFIVLNKNNSFFNAQTPNYDSSQLKKLEINTTSTQSTNPSMDVTATYNQK